MNIIFRPRRGNNFSMCLYEQICPGADGSTICVNVHWMSWSCGGQSG